MTNGEMLFLAILMTAFSVFGVSLLIQSIRDQATNDDREPMEPAGHRGV